MTFPDHFSGLAESYARFRPTYPEELFQMLAIHTREHLLAWDVGTGSGQSATELAQWFRQVVASDASLSQLRNAVSHPRVQYIVEHAETPSLRTGSVDLITVSTALHWFALDDFYAQVRRVAKSGGVLAVWTYYVPRIDAEVDQVVRKYGKETLAGHWDPQHIHVETGYRDLPFPFEEINVEPLSMSSRWTLPDLEGFLGSWSPVDSYRRATGRHPVGAIHAELSAKWGDPEQERDIQWDLHVRLARLP